MPIPLSWFAFPVNVLLMLTLVFLTYLICILPKAHKIKDFLSSDTTFIIALLLLLAGSLVIGLVPQQHSGCIVTFWNRFYQSWILATFITFLFGVLSIRTIVLFQQKKWKETTGKMLIYIGLTIVLAGGYYGVPDEETCRMDLSNIAFNNQMTNSRTDYLQLFPYKLRISKIEEEKYSSGQPKRITATIVIQDDQTQRLTEIQAGHPLRLRPYALHLRRYSNQNGLAVCTLLIVKNPWRWWIYAGMILLCVGLLLNLKPRNYLSILGLGAIMVFIFFIIKWLKPEIFHRELMPSLQSIWFVPHIAIYIMSYIFLCISFILSLIWIFKRKEKLLQWNDDMIQMGLMLFVIAMLIGSIWAEVAWGHFWTWDVKETWALITCCLYVIYTQYRTLTPHKDAMVCVISITAFIALLICWLGVDFQPAASGSMHIYH